MKRKLFSLLVLLLTAVTGAWADATIAKLWVGNSEEVTSEGTITGTGATEGTASVAIENGSMVLTLNNFKFNGCGYNDSGIYYQSNTNGNTPLIIKIEGDNEITLPGADKSLYGFYLYGGNGDHVFTITGSGSLTVTVGDGNLSNGIYVQQADLVLAGGTVTANAGSAGAEFKSLGVSVPQGTLTIDGCTLKASGSTTSASRGVNVMKNVTIKSGELEAYGYSKGIKNSDGGDALVFAEGVTPTLFKAGDNEASATDVSKYEGQKYLHVVCTGGDEPAAPAGDGVDYALSVGSNEHGTVKFFVNETEVNTAAEGQTVTVEITPATGWSTGSIKGLWHAAGSAVKAPKRAQTGVDLLKDFELEPVTGNPNAYTFTMKRANAEISVSYRKLLTHTDMNIADIAAVTYNGQAQTPDVSVKDGSADLAKDQDFSVSYTDNLNAGTATATIVGIGNYSGQVVKTFTIQKANLVVTAPTARILTYTGQAQTLINAATLQGAGNTDNCQLQYSTDNQAWQIALPEATNAGSYTVFYKAVADANHNDVAPQSINVSVSKAALTSILIGQTNLVYNRSEQSPVIAGVKAGALNVPAEAYSVSGDKATTVGNYELTVTAKSDAQNYTGSAKAAYSIIAANAQIFTISDIAPQTYSGTRLTPAVTVKDGPAVLAENTDYTLTYSNNLNAGTATVTAQGIGNYTGTQTKTFEIQRANVALMPPVAKAGLVYTAKAQQLVIAGSAEGGEMQYSLDRQAWSTALPTGTDAREYTVYYRVVADGNHNGVDTQNFKVTIGQATLTTVTLTKTYLVYSQQEQTTLVSKVNAGTIVVPAGSYDVTGNTATAVGTYTATVTGKGNFKGQVTAQYSIVAANASLFDITLGQTEYTYDGTAKTPAVTVKDGFTVLTENTDYTLTIEANTNAGTAKVTATGKGNYTGTRTKTFVIHPAVLTSVTLAQTEFSYNVYAPVAQTAEVAEVKAGNLEVPAAQYDVEGNTQTDPGLYTVTVTGKGNYTGSVTAQFVIKDMVVDEENVDGVHLTISVVDRAAQTLSIDNITLGTTASGEDVTLIIPAQINGWSVVNIAGGATAGLTNVTDVIMPDTEVPVNIGEGALPATATIHTPLALLGDYALMASLKDNYEAAKVVTTVTPGSMYWTLGLGCDVIVPSGIDVYTVQVKSAAEVAAEIIPEDLLTVNGERIIKANNGVLLLGEAGQSYDLVAYSGRIASGMPVTPQDLKDYGQENVLEPVIEKKDYGAGSYFVLEDNEFHAILAEGNEVTVPAGKAVLHLDSSLAGADALVLKIENGATGISSVGCDNVATDGEVYDLQGRRVVKAQKGLYIINGKKVMVK